MLCALPRAETATQSSNNADGDASDAGNGLIIANGPSERVFTLDELRRQWGTVHMKVFIGVMVALFVMLRAGILYVKVPVCTQFFPSVLLGAGCVLDLGAESLHHLRCITPARSHVI
jgi:hypothetical protein